MLQIRVLGSTNGGYTIPTDLALDFSAKMAGICYMPDSFDTILNEPVENTAKRVKQTLKSGHHSVYDHVYFNLLLNGIPKALAMVLNNEGMYTTSEKSARYTKMEPSPIEKGLYDKWYDIFVDVFNKLYRDKFYQYHLKKLSGKEDAENKALKATVTQISKLSQENARYMISVFTPTTMAYTVSLRQINYIRSWFEEFVANAHENLPTNYEARLKESMLEFLDATKIFCVEGLDAKVKDRKISLFDERHDEYNHIFDEVYSTSYFGSFAQLAQAQRHRTLRYKMRFPKENRFYIPECLKGNDILLDEWIKDINSVADMFPQGMMIEISERGTYEDFILKCMERLCGCAQLEIAIQTNATMKKYIKSLEKTEKSEVYLLLKKYCKGARCTFPSYKCSTPCVWGAKEAFTRLI